MSIIDLLLYVCCGILLKDWHCVSYPVTNRKMRKGKVQGVRTVVMQGRYQHFGYVLPPSAWFLKTLVPTYQTMRCNYQKTIFRTEFYFLHRTPSILVTSVLHVLQHVLMFMAFPLSILKYITPLHWYVSRTEKFVLKCYH